MTNKLREAAQAALEWLKDERLNTWQYMEGSQFYADRDKQVKALEAALAEPAIKESLTVAEQEPVAWTTMPEAEDWCFVSLSKDPTGKLEGKWFPLYAAPPRREWVGLTDADFEKEKFVDYNFMSGASFAESKLQEKNT
jgi:hypothetical protein